MIERAFEVDDRVIEIASGDWGVVVPEKSVKGGDLKVGNVWVDWRSGWCAGKILYVKPEKLELVSPGVSAETIRVENALQALTEAGFRVTLTKLEVKEVPQMTNPPKIKETEDWKLHAWLEWQPKQHSIDCPRCHGTGKIGGGFKDIEGERTCNECWGTGKKSVGPTTEKPELDPALVEYMRRAWWDFFNKTD